MVPVLSVPEPSCVPYVSLRDAVGGRATAGTNAAPAVLSGEQASSAGSVGFSQSSVLHPVDPGEPWFRAGQGPRSLGSNSDHATSSLCHWEKIFSSFFLSKPRSHTAPLSRV